MPYDPSGVPGFHLQTALSARDSLRLQPSPGHPATVIRRIQPHQPEQRCCGACLLHSQCCINFRFLRHHLWVEGSLHLFLDHMRLSIAQLMVWCSSLHLSIHQTVFSTRSLILATALSHLRHGANEHPRYCATPEINGFLSGSIFGVYSTPTYVPASSSPAPPCLAWWPCQPLLPPSSSC